MLQLRGDAGMNVIYGLEEEIPYTGCFIVSHWSIEEVAEKAKIIAEHQVSHTHGFEVVEVRVFDTLEEQTDWYAVRNREVEEALAKLEEWSKKR